MAFDGYNPVTRLIRHGEIKEHGRPRSPGRKNEFRLLVYREKSTRCVRAFVLDSSSANTLSYLVIDVIIIRIILDAHVEQSQAINKETESMCGRGYT